MKACVHIALLRGINVGGKSKLPMKELAAMFVAAGCEAVQTYIQSGNVVCEAPASLAKRPGPTLARRPAAVRRSQGRMSTRSAVKVNALV